MKLFAPIVAILLLTHPMDELLAGDNPSSASEKTKDLSEKERQKVVRLLQANIMFHNSYGREVVRVIGEPDRKANGELVYQMPDQYKGKVRSVFFYLKPNDTIRQIDYLDANRKVILSVDWAELDKKSGQGQK